LVRIEGDVPKNVKTKEQARVLGSAVVSELNIKLDLLMSEINSVISSRYCKTIRHEAEQTADEILLAIEVIEDILIV